MIDQETRTGLLKMKPYTFRKVTPDWRFWNSFYIISFDGTDLRVISSKDVAEETTELLNSAHQMGVAKTLSFIP